MTVSGAQGVLASPFAPLHGLGSPLAAPYAGSPVGGTHHPLVPTSAWHTVYDSRLTCHLPPPPTTAPLTNRRLSQLLNGQTVFKALLEALKTFNRSFFYSS